MNPLRYTLLYGVFTLSLLFSSPLKSTTIVPFPNLGEMALACDAVVIARAVKTYKVEQNGVTRFRTDFALKEIVKGQASLFFTIQTLQLRFGEVERVISGDVSFEEGESYLMFINHDQQTNLCRNFMLSHAVFKENELGIDEEILLTPVMESEGLFQVDRPDMREVEPKRVYYKEPFVRMMKEYVNGQSNWNSERAAAPYPVNIGYGVSNRADPPDHCTFLRDVEPYSRWINFPTQPLPVRYHTDGDPGCTNAGMQILNAVDRLNAGYNGINLELDNVHDFSPSCISPETATGSELTNYMSNNLGSDRNVLIQFSDPCDEIDDLVNCSGTLAIGGSYWYTSNLHNHEDQQWFKAAYGFVVVNDNVGNCYCDSGTDYELMITHELTHALAIGHITTDPPGGAANMNPSCCLPVSPLDIACLDYTYPAALLPVELTTFTVAIDNNYVELEWNTASETNNDYFAVEHSSDGLNFTRLGEVKGAGTTSDKQVYKFIHKQPVDGQNYYRIRQVDLDGSFAFSDIKAVDYRIGEEQFFLSPNPVRHGTLTINYATSREGEIDIKMYDPTGNLVFRNRQRIVAGNNTMDISTAEFSNGVYIIRSEINGLYRSKKVLIL